ncbi:MAG: hypothetical protein R3C45_13980 [Phycisphaerales bacterium]
MATLVRANPIHTTPGVDPDDQRPRTFYVDFARLEAKAAPMADTRADDRRVVSRGRVTTVDDEVNGLRRNVRDAAGAVLTWLASVTQHQDTGDLDRVLDKCLRPGADTTAVNYAALAQEINQALGLDLSAKRVQTAVRHIRDAAAKQHQQETLAQETPSPTLAQRFESLQNRLLTNHDRLVDEQGGDQTLRRAVANDVLCVLRSAAGRLIECGFGEGIPQYVDLDATRQRFMAFVRRVFRDGLGKDNQSTLRDDLTKLLSALNQHDDTAEADMQLVVAGACVVCDLTGPGSLPGLLARLNVLMVGRPMLDSEFFVSQMLTLADAAGGLIGQRDTHAYMSWVRLQPKDRRTPSPNRVRSYCLNNAATHILQRLHTGELTGAHWFTTAQTCFDTMMKHDRGFKLVKTTEAVMLSVLAEMTGNTGPVRDFFAQLGRDKSLCLLRDLARFDNSDVLNRLVRRRAESVHAGIASQLLVVPD